MALSTSPYKGARDFYPEDKRKQKYMFAKLRQVAERFGYEEYDAPILEPLEIYLAKSGEEIVSEQTYVFEDRGGRKVVIRPEMTPSVSRLVAGRRQQLSYPLRWYSIPNLWRYERPQRGRLREHWQLNVDIFGVADTTAELEIISLIDAVFTSFGASQDMTEIRINHRQLVSHVLYDYLGLNSAEAHAISKLIDKMNKLERADFITQVDNALDDVHRAAGTLEMLLTVLDAKSIKALPPAVAEHESANQVSLLLASLADLGINNVCFDPTIMRGFDYYTGIVFEVFDTHPDNNRAMLGGGRYDGLVGLFGVEPLPTVGFGWGDVTLMNFLESHHLLPTLQSEIDVLALTVGDINTVDAYKAADQLRSKGLNVSIDMTSRRLGDKLKNADKRGIKWVLIIGESASASGVYTLKNMHEASETEADIQTVITGIMQAKSDKAC